MTLTFWITSIVITATPGTGALFTIAAGLRRGARAGVVAALGCTLGTLPHLLLALSGAAAVLAASPVAFAAITWLGVAYLLYLAWGMWRGSDALSADPAAAGEASSSARAIGSAVLVNLLNPKLTLFFFVFLPAFVDPRTDGALAQMAGLGGVFMAITLAIFALYGVMAGGLGRFVIGRPTVMRWIGRVFAICFVSLAVLLAIRG